MKRTYDQDVADVAAVQAGDFEAWERLLKEYRPNLEKMARRYEDHFTLADAMDTVVSAFAEHVLTATENDAQHLRNQVARVAREALDGELHPGLSPRYVAYLRTAATAMRPKVTEEDPEPLSLHEAVSAVQSHVDAAALETFRRVEARQSIEAMLNERQVDDAVYFSPDFDPESCLDALDLVAEPVDSASSDSRVARVHAAIAALSEQQQRIVRLFMEGMNDSQIVAATGLSRSAVNTHRLRAFAHLRESLAL